MHFVWNSSLNNTAAGFVAFGQTPNFAISSDAHYLADVKTDGSMRIHKNDGTGFGSNLATTSPPFSPVENEMYELIFEIEPLAGGARKLTLTIDDPSEGGLISIIGVDNGVIGGPVLDGSYFGIRTRRNTQGTLSASFDNFNLAVVVPEPSTGLLMIGVLGLALTGWRRRRG